MKPKIKRSDNPEKMTNPGLKKVVRMFDQEGQMRGDVLFLDDEAIPEKGSIQAHHPMFPHVSKAYSEDFRKRELLMPIFQDGKVVYQRPSLHEIRQHATANLEELDGAYKRFRNPHLYHVSLSPALFAVKQQLLHTSPSPHSP